MAAKQTETSTEENKALTRRVFEEIWNQGDLALADVLVRDCIGDPLRFTRRELRTPPSDLRAHVEPPARRQPVRGALRRHG